MFMSYMNARILLISLLQDIRSYVAAENLQKNMQ